MDRQEVIGFYVILLAFINFDDSSGEYAEEISFRLSYFDFARLHLWLYLNLVVTSIHSDHVPWLNWRCVSIRVPHLT